MSKCSDEGQALNPIGGVLPVIKFCSSFILILLYHGIVHLSSVFQNFLAYFCDLCTMHMLKTISFGDMYKGSRASRSSAFMDGSAEQLWKIDGNEKLSHDFLPNLLQFCKSSCIIVVCGSVFCHYYENKGESTYVSQSDRHHRLCRER